MCRHVAPSRHASRRRTPRPPAPRRRPPASANADGWTPACPRRISAARDASSNRPQWPPTVPSRTRFHGWSKASMRLTRNPSCLPRASTSAMTRACSAGDGSAPSRMRPALGQPTSPITISLPAKLSATCLRIDRHDRRPSRAADRIVLPVRQDVHGDEIHRARQLAIAQPELPDIGIGDRHFTLRLHARDVFAQGRRRHFTAQQRLVADDHRAHGVGKAVGERDAGGDLVLRAVGVARHPKPEQHFQPVPLRDLRERDRGRNRPNRCARNR